MGRDKQLFASASYCKGTIKPSDLSVISLLFVFSQ